MPYTGRLAEGVRQIRRRWHHRVVTHEVPLPEMERFLSHHRDVDPLTLFLHWVGNQLGGVQEGQLLNSSRVFLRQPDHDRLLAMERFWAERLTGDPNAAWAQELNLAPMAIEATGEAPAWTRHGVVYVTEGAIRPGGPGGAI